MKDGRPNPGSDVAIEAGCTCPRLDNARGAGMPTTRGGRWWYVGPGCPLHDPPT